MPLVFISKVKTVNGFLALLATENATAQVLNKYMYVKRIDIYKTEVYRYF